VMGMSGARAILIVPRFVSIFTVFPSGAVMVR
jgi:hypothetical protein